MAAGPVTASIAPEIPIELSTGTCDDPASQVIAHGDNGSLVATVPAGNIRFRFYNAGPGFPQYNLHVIATTTN